jgi:hypothetical protein
MAEPQVTVDDLLKKIGSLVVQLEMYQLQAASLSERVAELERENAKLKPDDKK